MLIPNAVSRLRNSNFPTLNIYFIKQYTPIKKNCNNGLLLFKPRQFTTLSPLVKKSLAVGSGVTIFIITKPYLWTLVSLAIGYGTYKYVNNLLFPYRYHVSTFNNINPGTFLTQIFLQNALRKNFQEVQMQQRINSIISQANASVKDKISSEKKLRDIFGSFGNLEISAPSTVSFEEFNNETFLKLEYYIVNTSNFNKGVVIVKGVENEIPSVRLLDPFGKIWFCGRGNSKNDDSNQFKNTEEIVEADFREIKK